MRGSIKRYKGKQNGDSWVIRLDLGDDPVTGKRRQKTVTYKGSRKEAERKLAELITAVENSLYADAGRMTVADLLRRWLESKRHSISPRTYTSYCMIVEQHLVPALGGLKLTDLKPLHLEDYYGKALKEGRKDGKGKGLSATTVLYHHRVMHEALGQAVQWQLIFRNPAAAVSPPRKARPEVRALTAAQARVLLEALKGTPDYVPALLALFGGLRRGEILGLRWQDVDLDRGLIQIRQTLQWQELGQPTFLPPKTTKSTRVAAVPPIVVEALKEHHRLQEAWRKVAAEAWSDFGLVVCLPDGTPCNPATLSARFRAITAKIFGAPVNIHSLRHSCASLLMELGVHPKVVAEQLGHSTVKLTLDTYSHVAPRLQTDALVQLQKLVQDDSTPDKRPQS